MLSDEERKAINQLKADTSFYDYELKNGNYIYELFKIEVYKKDIDVILNLIEKQSKEIEELKKYEEGYKLLSYSLDNYTSNNKIKAKIEEWQKEKEFYNKDEDREWEQYNNWDWVDTIINEMQSLLEKE